MEINYLHGTVPQTTHISVSVEIQTILCKVLEICIHQYKKSRINDQFDEKMSNFLHSWSMQTKISDISLLMQIKENRIQL